MHRQLAALVLALSTALTLGCGSSIDPGDGSPSSTDAGGDPRCANVQLEAPCSIPAGIVMDICYLAPTCSRCGSQGYGFAPHPVICQGGRWQPQEGVFECSALPSEVFSDPSCTVSRASVDAGSGLSLDGAVTCPDGSACDAGQYCVGIDGGPADAGGPAPFQCRAPVNDCTVAPDGYYFGYETPPPADRSCAVQFCGEGGSSTVSDDGRVIVCHAV